jgi:prepilin-type processing-associated H-X9-DG protein
MKIKVSSLTKINEKISKRVPSADREGQYLFCDGHAPEAQDL